MYIMNNSNERKCYEEIYLSILKTLYFKNIITFKWIDFSTDKITIGAQEPIHPNNKFLVAYKNDLLELGRDILKNGMYSPFIGDFRKEINAFHIRAGKHRAKALKELNEIKPLNKKFLMINLGNWKEQTLENPIIIETFNTNFVKKKKRILYKSDIFSVLIKCINALNDWFFINKIQPLKILNDEKLFNEFIEKENNR